MATCKHIQIPYLYFCFFEFLHEVYERAVHIVRTNGGEIHLCQKYMIVYVFQYLVFCMWLRTL